MKKFKYFFLILAFSFATSLFSQNLSGIAYYKIKLGGDNLFFNAKLIFNNNESYFVSKQRNISKWRIKKGNIDKGDTNFISQMVYTDTLGHIIFRRSNKPYLLIRDFCKENKPVIYKDTVNINWKITNQKSIIQGLKCVLATAKFRGRNYKAWFTTSIPLPIGPWKFGGLPGLIVELRDDKQEVLIQIKSIESNNNKIAKLNMSGKETTLQKLAECKDKEWLKGIKKEEAMFAKLRAESPDLDIETETPNRRPATELNFNK